MQLECKWSSRRVEQYLPIHRTLWRRYLVKYSHLFDATWLKYLPFWWIVYQQSTNSGQWARLVNQNIHFGNCSGEALLFWHAATSFWDGVITQYCTSMLFPQKIRAQKTVWVNWQWKCLPGVKLYAKPLAAHCTVVLSLPCLEWIFQWTRSGPQIGGLRPLLYGNTKGTERRNAFRYIFLSRKVNANGNWHFSSICRGTNLHSTLGG